MPLNLDQVYKGTIVDRISEWGEDGKERNLNPIMRGIIVDVQGDPAQESIKGLHVCFGPGERKEVQALAEKIKPVKVTINDTSVMAFPIQARELNMVHDWESKASRDAWTRLFRIPTNVGAIFENRGVQGMRKRKTLDALGLTPSPKEGPVTDESSMEGMELPEAQA